MARPPIRPARFAALGLKPGDRVGVLGLNCPEWMLAMQVGAQANSWGAHSPSITQDSQVSEDLGGQRESPNLSRVWVEQHSRSTAAPVLRLPCASSLLGMLGCGAQACNRQSLVCVPLYETLGQNAIEFIINHSSAALVVIQAEVCGCVFWERGRGLRQAGSLRTERSRWQGMAWAAKCFTMVSLQAPLTTCVACS
jgi:acyl-CoA synthetase (AMP-forming)/AMP-acid ligase II